MKKVLSLVLVIAMVLSSMSFAFAGTFEDVTGDYEKAVDTLKALGVIDGYEDGTFRPEKTITRAEMAKLMVITLGYGDLVAGSKSNFADTQGHWADPYIALAAGKGIVIGDGNGNFRPDATVTYNEVFTMLVRGLGYTDTCNELAGMTWPTNFKVKAAELGITDDVVMNTTGADRGGVAQAIFNALNATLVTVDSDGNVTQVIDRDKNQVELFTRLADLNNNYVVTEEKLDPNNKNYGGDLVDLEQYMFQSLKVYLNKSDEVVYVKGSNSLVYEGTVDGVSTTDGDTTVKVKDSNGKVKSVVFEGVDKTDDIDYTLYEVFENGLVKADQIDFEDLKDAETIKIVAMDDKDLLTAADDDGKIDEAEVQGFVTTLRTDVVRIEKTYVAGKDSLNGIDLPLNDDDEVVVKVTGDANSLEDIKVDDIVIAYEAEDNEKLTLVVSRETVDGKVTKVTDKDTVSIDGTSYDLASMSFIGEWELELGDEGVFFLDQFGEIIDFEGSSVGPTDYAVIIGSADGLVKERFGYSVDTYPELKLATQDGEEVVYEVAVKVKALNGAAAIDKSAKYDADPNDNVEAGNLFTQVEGDLTLDIESTFVDGNAYLVQYSLDANGRIDAIDLIAEVTDYTDADLNLNDIDLDEDELVDGVILFDAGDDFAVIDLDSVKTEFEAYAVTNKYGDIEVLVVKAGEVDAAASTIYAYLNKVTRTYNDNGDKVNVYTVYVDGVKKDILADDDIANIATYNYAISFDYNGNVIDESDVNTDLTGYSVTATAINASKSRIELDLATADEADFADGWYKLSAHATIVIVDPTTTVPNGVDKIADLYDIDANDTIEVFFNTDGEIDLIVIGR